MRAICFIFISLISISFWGGNPSQIEAVQPYPNVFRGEFDASTITLSTGHAMHPVQAGVGDLVDRYIIYPIRIGDYGTAFRAICAFGLLFFLFRSAVNGIKENDKR